MGPKKGMGKAGRVVPLPPKKSQYIARITEMNETLAQLRKETSEVEQVYLVAEKRYEQVKEDMADIIQYLEHEIRVCDDEISGYDRNINKYNKEIQKQKKHYEAIYAEMDEIYEEKKRGLTEIIQSMTAKLNTFEEIRRQREDHLKRREDLQKQLEEMNIRHKGEMYEREKQVIIEQDKLQKEMEKRLEQLALDLREATDVRIGETTNRIIGDNIRLGNLLTCQQRLFTKMRDNFTAIKKIQKDTALDLELKQDEYDLTFKRYSEGAKKIEHILQTVSDMTRRIEELKKLVKVNRRLKRRIVELECYLKDLAIERATMLKSLEEVEDTMAGAKGNLYLYQRHIMKLQFSLFEAAKKVKEAIECENIGGEKDETPRGEDEMEKLEEAEREEAYRSRDLLIEEIISKLQAGNLSVDDLYQTSSIEFYENNFSHRSLPYSLSSKRSDPGMNIQNEEAKDWAHNKEKIKTAVLNS